jgi:chromate transporter
MAGSSLFLMKSISMDIMDGSLAHFMNPIVIIGTFLLLAYSKVRPPVIVAGCLLLGWLL